MNIDWFPEWPEFGHTYAVNVFKSGESLKGDWDYFSQDVNEKEISLFLVFFQVGRTYSCKRYDAVLSKLCACNNF